MPRPSGGKLEICFSLDTTMSMTKYVDQVKARLRDMVQKLQADIPQIRIALMAHGDFYQYVYDNMSPYVLRHIDFTYDVKKLCKFIQSADTTDGGDWAECYEYVLQQAGEDLSWSRGANKVFVLIGDAVPHKLDDPVNEYKQIDWMAEADKLRVKGIKLYGTYCKTRDSKENELYGTYCKAIDSKENERFFKDLSNRGNGSFLPLENFSSIFDCLMAICYREHGEDALYMYESEVKKRGKKLPKDVKKHIQNTQEKCIQCLVRWLKVWYFIVNKCNDIETNREIKPTKAAPTIKTTPVKEAKGRKQSQTSKHKTTDASQPVPTPKKTPLKTITRNHGPRKARSMKHAPFTQKKLRRENVPETNFLLREFPWSPWKPAYHHADLGDGWTKRDNGHIGYEKQILFKDKTIKHAVYECAVQIKSGKRKIIVFRNTGYHLSSNYLDSQIDKVLKKRCTVYVRRLIMKRYKRYKEAEESLKLYDYVWRSDVHDGESTRDLVRDDVVISVWMETN